MAQVYKSDISLTFIVAMVTKMAAQIGWNRKLTILEQIWDIWQSNWHRAQAYTKKIF